MRVKVLDCAPYASMYDPDAFQTNVVPQLNLFLADTDKVDVILCFRFCTEWIPLAKKMYPHHFIGFKTSQRWYGELLLAPPPHKCVFSQRTPLMTSTRNHHISQFTLEIRDTLVQFAMVESDHPLDSPTASSARRTQSEIKSELVKGLYNGTIDVVAVKTHQAFLPQLPEYHEIKQDDVYILMKTSPPPF